MERRLGAAPRPPMRLEPAAAGRRRARRGVGKKRREVVRNKGGPSQYPEKSAALAFFQGPQDILLTLFRPLTHVYGATHAD